MKDPESVKYANYGKIVKTLTLVNAGLIPCSLVQAGDFARQGLVIVSLTCH